MALFVERASAAMPQFELTQANAASIAELCARLEGLPLSIELAAARIKIFALQALLARLSQRLQLLSGGARDLPARQQTLYSTIKWSYDLLEQEAQAVFRLLSVFEGGCTLEAAEAVCQGTGKASLDVVSALSTLLDNSLLQRSEQQAEEPRFLMLETVREFGRDVLAEKGEMEAAQYAHAAYYLALAQEVEPHQFGSEKERWFARLEQEHPNLRAAMGWLAGRGSDREVEIALRLGGALWLFWVALGYWSEGRNFLESVLATHVSVGTSVQAKALFTAGQLAWYQGDFHRGEELLEEALGLYRQIGDQQGIALCLYGQGRGALVRHKYADARRLLEEALTIFRETGNKWGSAYTLVSLAHPALCQGEESKASRLLEESLALFKETGSKSDSAWALFYLARVILEHRDYTRARVLLEEGLALCRETAFKWGMAYSLALLGELAIQRGDIGAAYSLLEESHMLSREMGDQRSMARSLVLLASVVTIQGDYMSARVLYEESLSIAKALGRAELLAASIAGLGRIVAAQGEPTKAARMWGAAEVLYEVSGVPLSPIQRAIHEQAVAAVRAQLGEKAFATMWAEGRTMTPDQALVVPAQAASPGPVSTDHHLA